jgi:TRAP-type mannitol/chloroaromatic compound transport system permease large subunit
MEAIAPYLAPLMFAALALMLLSGVPVAFGLAAVGLSFAAIGIALDVLPAALMQALPLRLFAIMANETLLAVPFFTFMGLLLQRSHLAEDLLETVGQVFGAAPGGVALAVVLVGALLAATTGVVAASVISMGLISLPVMLRYGYNRRLASGVIVASGSLAQIIPPSLVLIVMADQLGRSVGDMYAAALVPAGLVVALQVAVVTALALFVPRWMPALPPEARRYRESDGSSGLRSLVVLAAIAAALGYAAASQYPEWVRLIGRTAPVPADERVIVTLAAAVLGAFALAVADRLLRLNWLSAIARRVAFVLIPPLLLIFLVLGTIFVGVATPTEGGALGAVGALALAGARGRLGMHNLQQALLSTVKLSSFVLFILVGSTTFSLAFQGVGGSEWVHELFAQLPGGATGFLLFVTAVVFVLGFFLDFFEIAFILLPLLAPVAERHGIDLVWFGVLVGINLQTSFLTPPFGFALFYLRSVAPSRPQHDPVSGGMLPAVRTGDIYWGVLPFVLIQVIVMGLVIAYPQMLMREGTGRVLDDKALQREIERLRAPAEGGVSQPRDPMLDLLESIQQERDAPSSP